MGFTGKITFSLVGLFLAVALPLGAIVLRNTLVDHGVSHFKSNQFESAFNELRIPLLFGDRTAEYICALMYAYGLGVPQDDERAIALMKSSAANDKYSSVANIAYEVGTNLAEGKAYVTEPDLPSAKKWLSLAAAGNNADAIEFLQKIESDANLVSK